jgi:hypothetical protein
MMEGQGYMTWPDGSYYKGGFRENRKSGYGIYYSSGIIFEGDFQNDS